MSVQVIQRDGAPEYAVLPWAEYQALLQAAGQATATTAPVVGSRPRLSQLTALREAKGLSPEQLARNVGISPPYLAMIERAERQPDDAILRALAWHLGVEGWESDS
ncbi:helix-turn-helix domain-containing protein [Pseudomonas xionganensis]|uniref:Helix-turn-helix domain-containing protein n=1 Tax=Pseudomonas xionganensis TaxID=2654845 RepID=A0A6I4KV02_9PSED|nr:helix-turn-helix transcriptional regulator [Pseudomonas xionganensis]MVW75481.1 helix-turn-helix domain-containing protein [Pseudomonas xionganensis]